MPVSEVSGLAGTLNLGQPQQQGNPMADMMAQLQKAQQMKKESAMTDLDVAMKLAEFDPKAAAQLGNPAIDTLAKHHKGQAGIGSSDMFQQIYQQSQVKQKQAADESAQKTSTLKAQEGEATAGAAASTAQTAHLQAQADIDTAINKARVIMTNPESEPKAVAQAAGYLMSTGKMTGEEFANIETTAHLTPEQLGHIVDNQYHKLAGEPTDAEYTKQAAELAPQMAKDYDGDLAKASAAANLLVRGKDVPAALQPPMTDDRINRESKIATMAVGLGWPQTAVDQAIAAGTTNTKTLSEKYGWSSAFSKIINDAKPLDTRKVEASESEARSASQEVTIRSNEARAQSAERIAHSIKEIAEAQKIGNGHSADMDKILKSLTAIKGLETKAPSDPSLKAATEALKSQLLTGLVDENGTPLLREEDIPTWMGLAHNRQFTFAPASNPDPDALKGASSKSSDTGAGLLSPETLGRLPGEMAFTGLNAGVNGAVAGVTALGETPDAIVDYIKRLTGATNAGALPAPNQK